MRLLLASSSAAALLIGGGTMEALAACTNNINAGFDNPAGHTTPCVAVTNTSFSGNITNEGTISPSGITFTDGTITGHISNSGTITGGIALDSASLINGGGTAIRLSGPTFTGGITNAGTLSQGAIGIAVGTFVGSAHVTFSGGISNFGTIVAGQADIILAEVLTFTGGITNSGHLSGHSNAGIFIRDTSTFSGGISNSGSIAAASAEGIFVERIRSYSGGITNTGSISAASTGIGVNLVSAFTGTISNGGTLSGHTGIAVSGSTIVGAIVDNGTILGTNHGIVVDSASQITGGDTAIRVTGATLTGGIANAGTLGGAIAGIVVGTSSGAHPVTTFGGGIINTGHVSAAGSAILVQNVATFTGNISNGGALTGANGIVIGSGVIFAGGAAVVNTGTITGTTAAIDVSAATSPVTIDQNGGVIAGVVRLSAQADVFNITGGSVSGNVTGLGASDTVNFSLGSGAFTYAAPFAMSGLNLVAVNSSTVFVDGSIGATTIDVNNGGIAAGTGSLLGAVFVTSGGTLMPGNPANRLGTLTVTGSLTFNAGSFYSVHVTPSTASSATIGGTTTINGGTVQVTLQQTGIYDRTYTIVTASGGRSGTFAGAVTTGAIALNGTETLTYDATHVFLTLAGTAGQAQLSSPSNLNINQQNVLNGINAFIQTGNTLPASVLGLSNLSGPALADALTHLSGENNAGFFQGAFQAGNSFLGLMVNPFLDGRFGNGGGFGAAIGFAPDEPPPLPQAAAAFASVMPVKAAPMPATFEQRFSVWGAAYGGSGRITGDPVVGSHDTTADAAAFAAGVDYRLSPDTLVGFALAGGGTSWSLTGGLGSGSSDMFQAGVYASHHWGAAYLSGALAYNFHDVTTSRTVTIAGTDMLQARFQANGVGARLEGGYHYATPWLGITPYAAAQVQSIALPNYGETATAGSNQFALNFASQTATTTRTELGLWLDRSTRLEDGASLTLFGRAAWAHDFGDTPAASAIFQALPGSNFIVNGATPAPDGALVTGGAKYDLVSGWSLGAKFDGEFSSTTSIYSGSGMVKKVW